MVRFDKENHQYFYSDRELISVTTLLGLYKNKFDVDAAAERVSKREGISKQFLLDLWEEQKRIACDDRGTPIHKAIEQYILTKELPSADNPFFTEVNQFANYHTTKRYRKVLSEQLLFNEIYDVAGTADLIYELPDNYFDIEDFKTNKKLDTYSRYNDFLLEPINHLTECEYSIYSLQVSLYAYLYEHMTGKKCRHLTIHYFDPNRKHTVVPCNYLKSDVIQLLEHHYSLHPPEIEFIEF